MKNLLLLLVLATLGSCLKPIRYDNFHVYRIIPKNYNQLDALRELENNPSYTFWSGVTYVNHNVDVMVAPHLQYAFENFLKLENFDYELWIKNVQETIENGHSLQTTRANFNWTAYQDLANINEWLTSLTEKYPGVVTLVEGGQSHEGRTILGVHVSFKPGNKAVFLEGGIHAREWIAPTTVTYILNQLLTSTDPSVRALAESRDWYAFPSVNPDGYEYTKIDRIWRKTRKPYGGACYGADANRNWGYHWMDGGATTFPCADTFAGKEPFSEIETKSLSEFISSIADNLEVYLGFHSYSQLLLIPFGHKGLEVPENNDELHRIGNIAAAKLAERYGTEYKVGNIPDVIYVGSGGSSDWVLGTYRHLRLVYTYELRDTGKYGFILPPSQIMPTGLETLDSIVAMFQELDRKK